MTRSRMTGRFAEYRIRGWTTLGIIAFGLASGACQAADRNRDVVLPWRAQRSGSLGGADDHRMSLSELYPFQLASDDSGRLYVLGWKERRVFKWSADLRRVDSIGREGSGPGEFAEPLGLWVERTGRINVIDLGLRRIVRWSAEGAVLPPIPITWHVEHPRMVVDSGRIWYLTVDAIGDGKAEIRLDLHDSTGTRVVLGVERQPRRVVDFPKCNGHEISVQPFFAPTITWAASGARMAAASGGGYRVHTWERGVAGPELGRPIPKLVGTGALALREAAGYQFNGCAVDPAEAVASIGYLPEVSLIKDLTIAPDGEVWVQRRTADGSTRIDLFDRSGKYEGTLGEEFPFPSVFLMGGKFASVEHDSSDVPVVAIYQLAR